jgi:hypothetical protein
MLLQDTVRTNYTGLPITLVLRNESMRQGTAFDIVVSAMFASVRLFLKNYNFFHVIYVYVV